MLPGMLNDRIVVRRGASYSAYILLDDTLFSSADFKLLSGQQGSGLLTCLVSKYNGMYKLTYFSDRLVPLQSCLSDISGAQFVVVLVNLLNEIVRVNGNGFLDSGKIDIDIEAIYVDIETCAVGLVYLPTTVCVSAESEGELFARFCQAMFTVMGKYGQLKQLIRPIAGYANNAIGRFSALLNLLRANYPTGAMPVSNYTPTDDANESIDSRLDPPPSVSNTNVSYVLSGAVGGVPIEIPVHGERLIVGKSRRNADYIIQGVATVSNVHCEFSVDGGVLRVRDLHSTNGTFVNGRRIHSGGATTLRHGDRVGVASVSLTVSKVMS